MHRPELNLPLQLSPVPKPNEMQTTPLSSPTPWGREEKKKSLLAPLYHTQLDTELAAPLRPLPSSQEEPGTGLEAHLLLQGQPSRAPASAAATLQHSNDYIGANEGWEAATNR